MSAYRPISKEDYLERQRNGDSNIGWAEGVGYYVEDRQALEEFWKRSDEIKLEREQARFESITIKDRVEINGVIFEPGTYPVSPATGLNAAPMWRINLLCEQHELYTKDELVFLIQKVAQNPNGYLVRCQTCHRVIPKEVSLQPVGSENHLPGLPQDVWMPIETAPKTGIRILLFQRPRGAFEGWWKKDFPHPEEYWMDDQDSEPQPTHWRPLLPPPSSTLSRPQRGGVNG